MCVCLCSFVFVSTYLILLLPFVCFFFWLFFSLFNPLYCHDTWLMRSWFPWSPSLQADSLPSKPPGNPQNSAMEMLKSMFWCTSPGQQPKGAFPSFRLFLLPLNLCAKKCWAAWLANCIVFNSLIFQAKEPILQWDTRPAFMHYSSGWQYEWLNNHIEFLLEIPGGLEIIT